MRKFLITGGIVFMMAAPAVAQSVSTETTTRSTTTEMNGPGPAPVIVHPAPAIVHPAPLGGEARIEQKRSTTIDSGSSGMSSTDRRSETYIGPGGEVRQERSIRREEVR
jgi:hypothetical protein